jgi:hypothetical protein
MSAIFSKLVRYAKQNMQIVVLHILFCCAAETETMVKGGAYAPPLTI